MNQYIILYSKSNQIGKIVKNEVVKANSFGHAELLFTSKHKRSTIIQITIYC